MMRPFLIAVKGGCHWPLAIATDSDLHRRERGLVLWHVINLDGRLAQSICCGCTECIRRVGYIARPSSRLEEPAVMHVGFVMCPHRACGTTAAD